MPLFGEQKSKIMGDLLIDIVRNTPITKVSIGSKTRAVADALSGKLGQMYRKFDTNLVLAFLPGAEGKYLDFIGDMMGISRLGQEQAQVSSSERNVKFYTESGTFGTINGGSSILLTSGTIVSSGQSSSGILYTVPYNVILSSSLSEVYIAVQATRSGTSSNIGANQLLYHNFTNYTDVANDTLKVVNEAEIIKGQDGEIDTNYRFRISQQVTAAEKANLTAIRLAALTTPGVADLVVLPYFRGIGTYDMLIKATTPSVPSGLLEAVYESLLKVTAHGIVPTVRAPVEVGISLTGTLIMKRKLSASEETNVLNAVTQNVSDYINSLDIGEDLIVNEMVERVMSTSDEIKNIGSANKPFDSIYTYKPTKLNDNKIRSLLIEDYTTGEDERVIVENTYGGDTPILFRVATA